MFDGKTVIDDSMVGANTSISRLVLLMKSLWTFCRIYTDI